MAEATWSGGRRPGTGENRSATSGSGAACAPVWARLLMAMRLPVFVAVSVGLALVAHVSAHGALPGLALVAFVSFAAVVMLAAGMHRSEASGLRVAALMGAMQAAMHVAFAGMPGAAEHAHASGVSTGNDSGMLLGHVLAAAFCCWWLRRGEAAVWRALRRVLPGLPPPAPALSAIGPVRLAATGCPMPPSPGRVVSGPVLRRGPPVPSAV